MFKTADFRNQPHVKPGGKSSVPKGTQLDASAILTPGQITASWLTKTFERNGLEFGEVAGLEIEPFPGGLSATGKIARLRLRYRESGSGPATMIAKMPDPAKLNSIVRAAYQREIAFYRELAADVGVRVPMMYHGKVSADSAVILLEDLSPAIPGDSTKGCSLDDARAAIRSLASMHARWWQSSRISGIDWLWRSGGGDDPDEAASQIDKGWSLAPPEFREVLPDEVVRLCSKELWFKTVIQMLDERPRTLTHPDFRLDNLFFDRRREPTEVTVIDWGRVTFAPVTQSLAYLLARESGLAPGEIKESLSLYQAELVKLGVTEYTPEDCMTDFHLGVMQILGVSLWQFWSGANRELEQRILDMRRRGWERVGRVLADFDCQAVLQHWIASQAVTYRPYAT